MTTRAFRFGVVATPQEGVDRWLHTARRCEELGYSSLLMPDGIHLLSPWPSLATAAAVTNSLHVGTFVIASPLRHPRLCAWDAHSLAVMSGGRFELGIGTGRDDLLKEAVRLLGVANEPPAKRLAQVEQTIDELRTLDGELHTPVMIAAGGKQSRALAARKADIVAVAAAPLASREEVAPVFAELREQAGCRFDEIELSMNIFIVGDNAPAWMTRFIGSDIGALARANSLTMLRGTPEEMADELERRREAFGVSYVTVNVAFYEALAPVVEKLSGK
jgi:probable F420-dependent oxidoreductase